MTEQLRDEFLDGLAVAPSGAPGVDAAGQPAGASGPDVAGGPSGASGLEQAAGAVAEAAAGAAVGGGPGVARLVAAPPPEAAEGADDEFVAALLDTMVERRSSVNRAEPDLLALVVDFADACPPDDEPGRGDGPPAPTAETAVAELGARLGVSYRAAADLVIEAVQLRDRLPRLWALVAQGRLQAFKARQVARVTASLSDAAAAFVDAHAAISGFRNRLPDLRKLVIIAINRCDPDLAEGLEEAAHADRGVTFEYSTSTDTAATARLEATLDVLDALNLDATISHLATEMGRLGDDTPVGVRRARALGTLANPQRTLDLFGDPVTPTLNEDTSDAPPTTA